MHPAGFVEFDAFRFTKKRIKVHDDGRDEQDDDDEDNDEDDEDNEDEFAYQGRLFWPSDFRDEVLARLLALNAERHAGEVRRGVAPGSKRARARNAEASDEGDALDV